MAIKYIPYSFPPQGLCTYYCLCLTVPSPPYHLKLRFDLPGICPWRPRQLLFSTHYICNSLFRLVSMIITLIVIRVILIINTFWKIRYSCSLSQVFTWRCILDLACIGSWEQVVKFSGILWVTGCVICSLKLAMVRVSAPRKPKNSTN